MFKKFLSLFIVFNLMTSFLVPGFLMISDASSLDFRDGFMLKPLSFDDTGIFTDSDFILTAQNPTSLEDIKKAFQIQGEQTPSIQQSEGNSFQIKLFKNLVENTLYTFKLNMATSKEITWTFQTRGPFRITSSLPGNQTTGVPVNSGIEINFSYSDFEDISPYFEIFPSTAGRFEVHNKTAVFVPDRLNEETLYSVKIKKGIKINGSSNAIDSDYVFSFETQKEALPDPSKDISKGGIAYQQSVYNVTNQYSPELTISYRVNPQNFIGESINVKTNVYAYGTFDKFSTDFIKKQQIPSWAYLNTLNNQVSTSGLSKLLEFTQAFQAQPNYSKYDSMMIKIPKTLPLGYYLLDSYWDELHFQSFLQVTNTGIYITKSNTKTLVWANDIISKKPLESAKVKFESNSSEFLTDQKGIAFFDTIIPSQNNAQNKEPQKVTRIYWGNYENDYLTVTTKDGFSSILNCNSYNPDSNSNYWQHIQTDRNIYKPSDTMKIWGFVKNRYKEEDLKNLTLEVSGGNYYFYNRDNLSILTKTTDTNRGFFEADFVLPNLEQGGYNLSLKKEGKTISSTYITVQKYTKPSYKIEISKDKKAVFPGQEVNFNVKTAFFEGTGVSNLQTDYTINDYNIGGHSIRSSGKTDVKGNLSVKFVPYATANIQGENEVSLEANATLPEIGQIYEKDSLRVFVNNIDLSLDGRVKDGIANITAEVKNIVLDRLNDGTAKNSSDYLGAPVVNKTITGKLYKNIWVAIESGDVYDYINKVSHKTYRYENKKTEVSQIYMTTDASGKARFEYPVPSEKDAYFTANFECTDNAGKKMSFERYLWEFNFLYNDYITSPQVVNEYLHFDGGRENYKIGEMVDLTLKKGTNPLPSGSYIYLTAQNGISKYFVSDKPNFQISFSEKDMPNLNITGIYFDEYGNYSQSSFDAKYAYEERKLKIEAKLDKASYKPGENVKISITVKDKDMNPVQSSVNARIVDEALLKLSTQNIELLPSLFAGVSSGINFTTMSHQPDGRGGRGANGRYITANMESRGDGKTMYDMAPISSKLMSPTTNGATATIRQDFKDTAYYKSVETDKLGHGEINFALPDNVTSWNVSLDGISQDLHAGSDKVNLKVSLPFFINYSFNSTYLVGDKPFIGVNAYGDGLKESDLVMFEIFSNKNPANKVSAVGRAFERVNIPLWQLGEGSDEVTIRAYTNNELGDAVKHSFTVVKSYYQIRKNVFQELTAGLALKGGTYGNTRIIFADKGRGQFLSELLSLAYPYGNRIDQKVSSKVAQELLNKHFKDENYSFETVNFDISDYQRSDGGLSLMTYGESDLDLSALLASQVKDTIDSSKLKKYFYDQFDKKISGNTVSTLLGLASLKEPVLIDLNKYSSLDNLSMKDTISLALAYYELGESGSAKKIYLERISPSIKTHLPYSYMDTGKDKDSIIELTAMCSILASHLSEPEREGLFNYLQDNQAKDIYPGLEKAYYIQSNINNYNAAKASLKYTYNNKEKVVDLSNGRISHLSLPSTLIQNLKILTVEGSVSAVSVYKEDVDQLKDLNNTLSISRKYLYLDGKPLINNSLKQGDMIKIQINWKIDSKALDGEYEITDYLPSGLKPVEKSYDMNLYYRKIDGQKVKYNVYNWKGWQGDSNFEYLARVISPGTYTAQGSIIQSIKAPDSINSAANQTITIDGGSEVIATPLDPKGIKVKVNDKPVIFDVSPLIESGRTLVPLRSIFEVLGAKVSWNSKTKTITCIKGHNTVVLTIGSNTATVNGISKTFDVPAKIIRDRTFVPTRFISESLGSDVKWDSSKKTVIIK